MKVKDLKEIIDTYNPEIDLVFIVMQQDIGEGGEDVINRFYAEDYFTYNFNDETKELEITIDL